MSKKIRAPSARNSLIQIHFVYSSFDDACGRQCVSFDPSHHHRIPPVSTLAAAANKLMLPVPSTLSLPLAKYPQNQPGLQFRNMFGNCVRQFGVRHLCVRLRTSVFGKFGKVRTGIDCALSKISDRLECCKMLQTDIVLLWNCANSGKTDGVLQDFVQHTGV